MYARCSATLEKSTHWYFPPVVNAGYDGYKAKISNKYEIHGVLNTGPMVENMQRRNTFSLCARPAVWSACAVLFIGGIYQMGE